jgi:mono/diheme cytochrome c family protein
MPRPVRVLIAVLLAALVSALAAPAAVRPGSAAGQAATTSVRDGVYSRAQAARGQKIYGDKCAGCHPVEAFTDQVFLAAWNGQTAHALFTSIRTTMPQENPGGLRRQDYADLLAYLLQLNKLPAGSAELGASDEALKKVLIEPPANKE